MSSSTNKIKFGVNIIYDENIYKAIDFALKNKFSGIELWVVSPQFLIENYSKKERAKITEYSQKKNIQIQIHAPENISLFESNKEVWKGYFNYLKELVDFGRDIKAFSLTIQSGRSSADLLTFPRGQKVLIIDSYPEYFLEVFKKNLKSISDYAKGKIFLCIENVDKFDKSVMHIVQKLLNQKRLFLTWDIAKSYNRDGTIKKEELNFFLKNIKSIKNIHLHDATSISGHEIIGKGVVDFKFFFKKLKNLDVNYIFEVRPHSNALQSRANLLKILK